MKKIYALVLGFAFFANLYGFTVGAGLAGYDLARNGRSFSLIADAALPIIPTIHWRAGLFNLNFHLEPQMTFVRLGTGLSSDLLFFIPVDMPVTPYLVTGVLAGFYTYENMGQNTSETFVDLKAGLGGQTDIGSVFGYFEVGTNFSLTMPSGGDTQTDFPIFVQLGIRKPLKFKISR
jgi:hypothetical protein